MLRRLLALLLLAGCATAQQPLAQKIDALTAKFDHSLWGIVVEDEAGRRLYEKNATRLFIPASNRKLFSGATAADCARPVVDTDPLFVSAAANVTCSDDRPSISIDAANNVTIAGPMPSHFHSLNAIASPALYAAQALASALKHAGIAVRGVRINTAQRAWQNRIATILSPPMWQLLSIEMKPSQNLYAEMLYKDAGRGAYDGAREAERRFLTTEVGIDPAEFRFVDGSGVSATNFVAPEAAVKLLRWMNHPARRAAWWLILATPGEEGTLHRRLTELAPRLRGKTGTLTGVNALSGIVTGSGGDTRYFTIFLNHHAATSDDAQRVIDAIAREIAAF